MLRVYCDTNIYSLIKENNKSFNSDLRELMDELKDILIFTYSHAHHLDLSNSLQEYWQKDLEFLETYVKDHYFNYNPLNKDTECLLAKPTESFYDTDFTVYKNYLNPDFNITESLLNEYDIDEDDEIIKTHNEIFKNLLNLSIPNLFIKNENTEDSQKSLVERFLPSQENLTIGNLTSHFFNHGQRLFSDKEEFKSLKKMISDYADTDKYSFEKWKDQYDKKFKENFQGKSFTEIMQQLFDSVPNDNEYDKFILFFSCLEGYNITKDKPLRKSQGYYSIHTDANHAWYASFSDFLVSDDKGLRAKAYITYKFFNIETEILDVDDFLKYKTNFLQQEEISWQAFVEKLLHESENSLIIEKNSINQDQVFVTMKNGHHFFNYFNRILQGTNFVILYCQRSLNSNFIMYKEGQLLTNKLINLLGNDSNDMHYYDFEKDSNKNKIMRHWLTEELEIIFGYAQNNGGICYCLELLLKK